MTDAERKAQIEKLAKLTQTLKNESKNSPYPIKVLAFPTDDKNYFLRNKK